MLLLLLTLTMFVACGGSGSTSPDEETTSSDSVGYAPDEETTSSDSVGHAPDEETTSSDSVGHAPTADSQSLTTEEDTARSITLSGADADGDILTYTVTTDPMHGVLSGSASDLTYTPTLNYHGNDSFKFKVNDGTNDSAEATVHINVGSINDAPTVDIQSVTVDEDSSGNSITLIGTDVDGDILTYTVTGQPSHGTLSGTAPNLTYTPTANHNGCDCFKFKVNDGTDDSEESTVFIIINSVNDFPSADAGSDKNTTEGWSVDLNGTGTDSDGFISSYTWTLDTNSSYVALTQNITVWGLKEGTHIFTLTVTDNEGGETNDTVVVNVANALSALKKTGQTISYTDYDDGDYQVGIDHNYTRDDVNDIVTDHVTGLQWQDDSAAASQIFNWTEAIAFCDGLELGGHTDWRLPSRKELGGIVKYDNYSPAFDPVFVNAITLGDYRSSDTYAGDTGFAWIVNARGGYLYYSGKSWRLYVRCVRTGE